MFLVLAKSRVAPLRLLTLPQIELMGAVIGARLASHVLSMLDFEQIVFWTGVQSYCIG